MAVIELKMGTDSTTVVVEEGALSRLGEALVAHCGPSEGRVAVVVTDQTVGGLYGSGVGASLVGAAWQPLSFTVSPGEQSKRLTTAGGIYQFLSDNRVGRDSVIVALGGGVVSDLAGFVAATWMRGVDFAICPTSLESCVDASIGGKTAVNIPGGKNLVGVFHQPKLVAIDPRVLSTLPPRDICAGLAESIKHGLLFSEEFLLWHEQNASAVLSLAGSFVGELIERNVAFKGDIVSRDVREQSGDRILLNFGHTIGHAIETCCGFSLRHGECVSLGMVAACRLSQSIGLLGEGDVRRVESVLSLYELPVCLPEAFPWSRISEAMLRDKKATASSLRFVLLEGIGRPVVRDDVGEADVRAAYESLI
jgi:3-dehydroquinate synthase